ncbi:MAG: hypothetical protein H0W81_03360 [Chloroflexi bacterium]|nr:hypothetical protein [Chloroflexota bacterium]
MNAWRWFHSAGVLAAVAAIGASGYFIGEARFAWLATMALMVGLLVVVGLGIAGHPAGAWIDERNKMTLSRLQLIAWTVVVLSGFLVAALHDLQGGADNALSVAIPEVLWLAMGISTVSLVGSPLILATKKQHAPNLNEATRTLTALQGSPVGLAATGDAHVMVQSNTNAVRTIGQVEVRGHPSDASWADIFRGDETGNAAYVDLGKVQMLLLTVVVLLVYGLALYTLLSGVGPFTALPVVDQGVLALLGISHAGYLSTKATTHSAPPAG